MHKSNIVMMRATALTPQTLQGFYIWFGDCTEGLR